MERAQFLHLKSQGLVTPSALFAGHSLGEYTFLSTIGGIMPFRNLLSVVFYRAAANITPSVLLKLVATIALALPDDLLEIANYNVEAQQYVAANAHLLGPADSSAILYTRPLLIPTSPHLSLTPVLEEVTLAVYVHPASTYLGIGPIPACISTTYDRAAPLGTGHAKVGGNYAAGIVSAQAALKRGYAMQLFLDARTRSEVEEFGSSLGVIESVTSDTLQTLVRDVLGWNVERRRVPVGELASFKEVIAVGTAVSVLPIASITNEETGERFGYCENGEAGPAAKKLNEAIGEAIRGSGEELQAVGAVP